MRRIEFLFWSSSYEENRVSVPPRVRTKPRSLDSVYQLWENGILEYFIYEENRVSVPRGSALSPGL